MVGIVCGSIGLAFSWIPFIGLPVSIVGLVKSEERTGLALSLAGLATSLLFALLFIIFAITDC